jgi:hypothetical protein
MPRSDPQSVIGVPKKGSNATNRVSVEEEGGYDPFWTV